MTAANKAPRRYRSPLRQEQAARTRVAVLDAAGRMFGKKGFAATTMKDIAGAADVSVESVYAQGTKAEILLACVDRSIVGDDEQVPLLERAEMRKLLASTDIEEKLAILRALVIERMPATAPIFEAFRGAAGADPKLAADWREYERRRYADTARIIAGFEAHLRPGLTLAEATDIYWAFLSPSMMVMLARERGWTAEQYADLLIDTIRRLLLGHR
jgi:AcrR family transcriptional regulator